jgi:hypothetical protein
MGAWYNHLMSGYPWSLQSTLTAGATISEVSPGVWRFMLPNGDAKSYRLAQLDDYSRLSRKDFLHRAPTTLSLRARASAQTLPGTWGFGLWNDPYSMGILSKSGLLRLPSFPNTAWFFFASPPNYLSLRDDLPAQGSLAATFHSPVWTAGLLPLSVFGLPLLALPPAARLLRRLLQRVIHQAAIRLPVDPTTWHTYQLEWKTGQARFQVDEATMLETDKSPEGPLGLVIWIDNQYLSFGPEGRLRYGFLECADSAWIEIGDLVLR